jgi:hypothetical protein
MTHVTFNSLFWFNNMNGIYKYYYIDIKVRLVGDFFPGTPVSSTNKTDLHDIAEILLKVALNKEINQAQNRK